MTETSRDKQSNGFSFWLRMGRPPPAFVPCGLEIKFNHSHDPGAGRFIFAGGGAVRGRRIASTAHGEAASDLRSAADRRVKETTRTAKPWKAYNDTAAGARPGQAPTLMRTMADGSKRPVKFDGIQGDYVTDRKWSVADRPRARAQILRQSQVLAEHRLTGIWKVPTPVQKLKALKINITNIHVKVVKP